MKHLIWAKSWIKDDVSWDRNFGHLMVNGLGYVWNCIWEFKKYFQCLKSHAKHKLTYLVKKFKFFFFFLKKKLLKPTFSKSLNIELLHKKKKKEI